MRLAILSAAVLAAFAGCNRPNGAPAGNPPAAGPATVKTVHPQRRSVARFVEQPGAVFAFEETPLFAKVPGYVKSIAHDPDKKDRPPHDRRIDTGSRVKKGQVLAELDLPELAYEVGQKAALVKQAEEELEQARQAKVVAESEVVVAEAAVTEAKAGVDRATADVARWASEEERVAKLVEKKVTEQQTLDEMRKQLAAAKAAEAEARARVVSATAGVRKSKALLGKAVADVSAAEAHVAVAKAEAARLTSLLRYTELVAPFDGLVTRRGVDPGALVRPDAANGQPLFVVARLDVVRVRVDVPEADAALVHPGADAMLDIPAVGGGPVAGKVARISWSLEPNSRTLRAEVDLDNHEQKLRPGMYVSARIAVPQPEGWALPAAAVVRQGDQWACFEVREGKAVRVGVRVGRGDGEFVEVLKKQDPAGPGGWADFHGSETVAASAGNLTDGQPVEVTPSGK